ncbi:hypothetical protein XENTR_v10000292 [Xenopus tropicalis]|nr:hypothetical protein XENTR_v10000292 [Xenopus tropicalis]
MYVWIWHPSGPTLPMPYYTFSQYPASGDTHLLALLRAVVLLEPPPCCRSHVTPHSHQCMAKRAPVAQHRPLISSSGFNLRLHFATDIAVSLLYL